MTRESNRDKTNIQIELIGGFADEREETSSEWRECWFRHVGTETRESVRGLKQQEVFIQLEK